MATLSNYQLDASISLLQFLIAHKDLVSPVCCPFINKPQDVRTFEHELPLVCLWNEDPKLGSFVISINGAVVGRILEQKISRDDANFPVIVDEVVRQITELTNDSIVSTCQKFSAMPSLLFATQQHPNLPYMK